MAPPKGSCGTAGGCGIIGPVDIDPNQPRYWTRWGLAGLILAWGGLGLAHYDPDGRAEFTRLIFFLLSILGALLALVCGLAHPERRIKWMLILFSLGHLALIYQIVVAPVTG